MQKVLTAAEMREVDRLTTEKYGVPSILLMENAADSVARLVVERLGGSVKGKLVLVLCGKGNNGGDGAAIARKLGQQDAIVTVALFGKIAETTGDARVNFDFFSRQSIRRENWFLGGLATLYEITSKEQWEKDSFTSVEKLDLIVDAMFGTGLTRPLDGWISDIVRQTNFLNEGPNVNPIIVSVDLPSGLDADSGSPIGEGVRADLTVTFTAPKPANILAPASHLGGELIVADIGSPLELIESQASQLYLAEKDDVRDWLDATGFTDSSYKNKRGHALLIAGSEDYSGAAVLAGNAAMRSGVGLVTLATPKSSKDSVAARILPEVMLRGVAETENGAVSVDAFGEVGDLLEKADAVAIGCGFSRDESTREFVKKVVENRRQPTIVDADALNLLSPFAANWPPADAGGSAFGPTAETALILTPHEGEFMRLLGEKENHPVTTKSVATPLLGKEGSFAEDRVAAVREFAQKHNVILVLKGERVLIGEPGGKVVVNPTGNSGLGKAGNGDTLTGIIAGFAAQAAAMKIDMFETVVAAVYLAGLAGDIAEKKYGKRVMTASDVRECLTEAFAQCELEK